MGIVLGIDPGTHTGCAVVESVQSGGYRILAWKEFEGRGEDGEMEMVDGVLEWMSAVCDEWPVSAIAMEDFFLNHGGAGGKGMSSAREGLSAVRVAWMIRYGWRAHGWNRAYPCYDSWRMQNVGTVKGSITDARLKRWGLWVRGTAHVRDAVRHAVWLDRNMRAVRNRE